MASPRPEKKLRTPRFSGTLPVHRKAEKRPAEAGTPGELGKYIKIRDIKKARIFRSGLFLQKLDL
jgi:hypothetical protein